jgi:6-phosphogluconolactonase (cycloisomerase 2 family)
MRAINPLRNTIYLGAATLAGVAAFVLSVGQNEISRAGLRSRNLPGGRLIAVDRFSAPNGEMCQWLPASASEASFATFQGQQVGAVSPTASPAAEQQAEVQKRPPVRTIRDPYSAFSSVTVDPVNDEVIFTDENLFQIMVYDRKAHTPPTAKMTEPKRIIGGLNTKIEFNCGVYVDPKNGDIYTISHDSDGMPMTIFNRQAKGNMPPTRELDVPKGTYGIAVDEDAEELFFAIQHDSAVSVYRKYADRDEPPIRLLQGDKTQLGDAHGIALDTKNQVMFVSNYGFSSSRNMKAEREKPNWPQQRSAAIPGSGRIAAPSINVYPLKAHGDVSPLRVIQGPKTQLNMPSHLFLDQARAELFLANDMGNSILVFDAAASGDVAPKRVLKGPKTLIQNPTGVFVDLKNDELWVASFGSRAATVFKRTADGDTAPLRVIRNGPMDAPALMIGNPGAVGYDTKREEILVPN